jgi:DNA polymerase-3 subunit delta'
MTPQLDTEHPRSRFSLEGVEAQATAFLTSLSRARLHHAWLLTGPEGVGKAAFAYRAARRLLGAKPDDAFGPLGASPDDVACRMIAAQAHPDLLVLERNTDVARKVIPVEEARRLPEFFAKAPAMGPYRVAIIDAVDDFNANGANAVLKTLEEPSGRGVLFLISHAPGRLLPTIRSRCRTLAFRPWTDDTVATLLEKAAIERDEAVRVAAMANGSPGRALALARANAVALDQVAQEIVAGATAVSGATLMSLAESFRGGEGAERFALFLNRLSSAVQRRAAQAEGASAARWAGLWVGLSGLTGRVEGLNLDRADAFWSTVNDILATARA